MNRPPDSFAGRLMIFDADQHQVLGPPPLSKVGEGPPPPGEPIALDGKVVGYVKVLPRDRVPGGVDSRFLQSQYFSAGILGSLILLIAALPAWLFARAFARRLEDIRTATGAIASGDFSVQLTERGSSELSDTIRNINIMTASLQRLETARRRWLAEVSHELRTPLSALRAELDAMLDGVRPITPAALASINEEAFRLTALVEDLHLLAMSDLDGPICQFVGTDAAALVRAAMDRFGPSARDKGLALTLEGAEVPVATHWDPARIDQALGNLLTNSIRYTDAPGAIHISLNPDRGSVRIVVEDTAPCPARVHLPHLFEPLYRVDAHRSRISGGSGMGLAICEAIVRAHHGTITATPSRLGGLAVTIALPLDARLG